MSESGRNIVIILYQYSVVVKGIEKKLSDEGYYVDKLENFELIPNRAASTDLFITYLPGDVYDDREKRESLKSICKMIDDCDGKMIVIGETKYHRELVLSISELDKYVWLDRPVDMTNLISVIEDVRLADDGAGKKRILIVDDDPSYAGMVKEWIKNDYKVDIVTSGVEAIKFLIKKPVNLILLDYEMPVVDGPQVLEMLKQEPATAQTPVIFLTGIGTKEAVQRVMSLKPEGYILKSTTRSDLLDYLHSKL